jgi:hypothetical protein
MTKNPHDLFIGTGKKKYLEWFALAALIDEQKWKGGIKKCLFFFFFPAFFAYLLCFLKLSFRP